MYVDDSGLDMTLHSACLWKKGFRIPVWPQLTVQFEVSIRLVKHLGWDSHVAGITHVGYRGRELILSICCFCTCMCNEMKETHRNSEQVLYITFFQSFTGTWEVPLQSQGQSLQMNLKLPLPQLIWTVILGCFLYQQYHINLFRHVCFNERDRL